MISPYSAGVRLPSSVLDQSGGDAEGDRQQRTHPHLITEQHQDRTAQSADERERRHEIWKGQAVLGDALRKSREPR